MVQLFNYSMVQLYNDTIIQLFNYQFNSTKNPVTRAQSPKPSTKNPEPSSNNPPVVGQVVTISNLQFII